MSKEKQKSVDEIFDEFWAPIVMKDGQLDVEQVKKELADFYFMIDQVPKVYDHVTGGLLSKPTYHADTVIEQADAYMERQIQSAIDDHMEQIT